MRGEGRRYGAWVATLLRRLALDGGVSFECLDIPVALSISNETEAVACHSEGGDLGSRDA